MLEIVEERAEMGVDEEEARDIVSVWMLIFCCG